MLQSRLYKILLCAVGFILCYNDTRVIFFCVKTYTFAIIMQLPQSKIVFICSIIYKI